MTYVDRSLGNDDVIRFRVSVPHLRARVAQARDWSTQSFLSLTSCLSYLATERGPTASASMLAYAGIAAAGMALYEAWVEADARRPNSGLVYERGCLRRVSHEVRLKVLDEVGIHRELLERSFNRHVRSAPDAPRPPLRFWR